MTRVPPLLRPILGLALLILLLSPAGAAAQVAAGWSVIDLPSLTEYHLYVPSSVDQESPSPLIVFLHGAGATPTPYRDLLAAEADLVGAVLALPKSTTEFGWGAGQDQALVEATISNVQNLLSIESSRISVSGHSAGGAYGYLLAYDKGLPFSGVFTLAAPFLPLSTVPSSYVPPIRMAYGTQDPNFQSAYPQLVAQWNSLGVTYEVEEVAGAGHNDLPTSTILAGFIFLVSQNRTGLLNTRCETNEEQLCLIEGRFRVTVAYTSGNGEGAGEGGGIGRVASMKSDGSGLFWFFDPLNWEMLVKVLDGCSFNDKFWVLVAASTNLSYTVTIQDLATGELKTYENQLGKAAPAVVDLDAFATCSG